MGCGEICQPDQYCDEARGVCTECSLICPEGPDARCQEHCSGYMSYRPPTSSTSSIVTGSTPQCEACSHVALYLVLSLALLLLLSIVVFFVIFHIVGYRKDLKRIFYKGKGFFLTRHGSNSSREGDAEAQPLIDHWTEIVTCWRELTKLLDRKDPSQAEDEAVDCTCAQLAVDFKRWAGLFGKHGDTVRYTPHIETSEDRPGGSSQQSQTAVSWGERSRHPTTTTDQSQAETATTRSHEEGATLVQFQKAGFGLPTTVQKTTGAARPKTHGAHPNAGSRRAHGPQTSTTRVSRAPGPQTTDPVQCTNGGNADRAANNDGDEENEDEELNLLSDNSGRAAASAPMGGPCSPAPPCEAANPNDGTPPPTDLSSVTLDSGGPLKAPVQSRATEAAAKVVNRAPEAATSNHRAEENEEGDFNLLSDNSGGAAASAPLEVAAPDPEERLSLSLDLRSDHTDTSSMECLADPSPFDHAISRLRERSKSIPGVRFRAVTMFKNYLELYVAIDDRSRNIQTIKRRALEIAGLGSSKLLVIEGTPPPIGPV